MQPQAESQRFQIDAAAVDGIQLVTVLFQMGREDIVDVTGDADSRCNHGKQSAHPFVVLAADIGLPAFLHDAVVKQMFGIHLKGVSFPAYFSCETGEGASSPADVPVSFTSSGSAGIPVRLSVTGSLQSSF